MPRVSRDQAQANRLRVAKTAAKLYREGGLERTSVAEIMEGAGMTIGAFHRQFGSKEALAIEACHHAFTDITLRWQQQIHEQGASGQTFARLMESYLSPMHRDGRGDGCAASALAGDVAHQPPRSRLRKVFTAGMRQFADMLGELLPAAMSKKKRQQRALAIYATLVGAITLARASSEDAISEEVLSAAFEAVKLLRTT
jgi:TetR/AcrR family transcriptional repressor of nem operon